MLSFEEWVNAAGYTEMLTTPSKFYFNQYGGSSINQMYERIGQQDPLVTKGVNPLKIPTENQYSMSDLKTHPIIGNHNEYARTELVHSLDRHDYTNNVLLKNNPNSEIRNLLLVDDKLNSFFISNIDYLKYMQSIIENEIEKIFKNYTYKNAIKKYISNKIFAISYDENKPDEFKNTGFYGEAIGLGARFNLDKIVNLIRKMNPEQANMPNDFPNLSNYVKNSEFYNEMMKTNRYLALSCTINEYYNKSNLKDEQYYINPNSDFVKALSTCIFKRNNFSKQEYENYMSVLTKIYYALRTNGDEFKFIDIQDINNLNKVINKMNNVSYYPTSY